MKAGKNKLLIDLEGESLIYWTLKSVFSANSTNWVGIIGQPKDKNLLLNSAKDFAHKVHWINGGETRQQSVFNGLKALPKDAEKVLIHDGARCLINPELIDQCAKQLDENEAVILATKVTDTIKIIDNEKEIKLVAEMLNLLGCSKESFVKLINKMGYKTFDKNNETFFKYLPKRGKNANVPSRKNKDNPFSILSEINFK